MRSMLALLLRCRRDISGDSPRDDAGEREPDRNDWVVVLVSGRDDGSDPATFVRSEEAVDMKGIVDLDARIILVEHGLFGFVLIKERVRVVSVSTASSRKDVGELAGGLAKMATQL